MPKVRLSNKRDSSVSIQLFQFVITKLSAWTEERKKPELRKNLRVDQNGMSLSESSLSEDSNDASEKGEGRVNDLNKKNRLENIFGD